MDKALKQRLVGASVLVALAVVILPMLLGGQPDSPQESQPIEIPPRPAELSFETRRFPIGEQPADQPSVLPEQEAPSLDSGESGSANAESRPETLQERLERVAAESAETVTVPEAPVAAAAGATGAEAQPEPSVGGEEVVQEAADDVAASVTEATEEIAPPEPAAPPAEVEPAPVQAETPAPVPAAPAQPDGRYVVQVASFSSTANANRLAGSLRESGMPVLMDTVDSSAGVLHRVRVGPFDQQAEADQVLTRLSRQVPDVRPRIVDLRPDEASRVTEPNDPLVRWSVQVGVFSESENAEQLVFQLRDAGFRAQSQREQGNGRTIYRVLVGPEVSRDDAIRSRDRIEASQGIRGIVQSTE